MAGSRLGTKVPKDTLVSPVSDHAGGAFLFAQTGLRYVDPHPVQFGRLRPFWGLFWPWSGGSTRPWRDRIGLPVF